MINYNTELVAALGGLLIFVALFIIVCAVIIIIANWKIFKKAGQPGWAAIIPYYNTYITYEIVNMKEWFVVYLVAAIVGMVASGTLATISSLVTFGLSIYANINLAKAFGKSGGFAVGLIFLPIVFLPILAFGDATYQPENL